MALINVEFLEKAVLEWAKDRNILDGSTRYAQWSKSLEELKELLDSIVEDDRDKAIDAIGDVLVTLVIQAHFWKTDLTTCLDFAYNEIKDRKGKLIDGIFVKES